MVRILVIGSNSFIGKNYYNLSKFQNVDIVSVRKETIGKLEFNNYNVVIYLPAIHLSSNYKSVDYYKINRDLCIHVAKSAKLNGIKHFVFISTVKVYGNSNPNIIYNELSECNPTDDYGKSKLEAENELIMLEDKEFIVSIVRSPLVYGKGVKANMLKIKELVVKLPFLPLGKINNRRSMIYVGNLVAYIDRIIEKGASGIFIAQDNDILSTSELIKIIAEFLNKKIILFKLPKILRIVISKFVPEIYERLFESSEFNNDITNKRLNYTPPYSTKDGIGIMIKSSED